MFFFKKHLKKIHKNLTSFLLFKIANNVKKIFAAFKQVFEVVKKKKGFHKQRTTFLQFSIEKLQDEPT